MNKYLEKTFSLKGKTAIITGGSRGIGKAISIALYKAGANVVCVAKSSVKNDFILKHAYKQCDITDSNAFKDICEFTYNKYGSINILVNAAGITLPINEDTGAEDRFSATINTNLNAVYGCCKIVAEYISNTGSIINLTSIGSIFGFPDNPGYIASKGGLRALTKALAVDFGSRIRVNNIAPGYVFTDMTKNSYLDKVLYKDRLNRMIIDRWGNVDDIVGAAIFLASDASSYITGIDLVIDGGWSAKGL